MNINKTISIIIAAIAIDIWLLQQGIFLALSYMAHEILYKLCSLFAEAAGDRNEYMRNYMSQRYHSKRDNIIKQLGGKCKRCGSTKDLVLDHIDSKKKTFRAADIHSVSDEKAQKEIKNLQVLCKKCHHEKTNEAWDHASNTPKPHHGSYNMYRKHGCRCRKCSEAYKAKGKEWREARRKDLEALKG